MSVLHFLVPRLASRALQRPLLGAQASHTSDHVTKSTICCFNQFSRTTLGGVHTISTWHSTRSSIALRWLRPTKPHGHSAGSLLSSSRRRQCAIQFSQPYHVSQTQVRHETSEAARRPGAGDEIRKLVAANPESEIENIFGPEINTVDGIMILKALQEQRRHGTLDEELDIPPDLVEKGLMYLREKYPLDEELAVVARVDRELDGVWNLPQRNPERSMSGTSVLDEFKKHKAEQHEIKKLRREAEVRKRKKEQQKLMAEEAWRLMEEAKRTKSAAEKRRKTSEAKELMAEAKQATSLISKPKQEVVKEDDRVQLPGAYSMTKRTAKLYKSATEQNIPQMTSAERIFPSAFFTAIVILSSIIFVYFYSPPAREARFLPDIPPAAAFIGLLIAVNAAIWLMWRIPDCWKFCNRYLMLVPAIPRPPMMLGAAFSHQKIGHLLSNMIPLWILGTQLHEDIGRGSLIALVACGAVLPSFVNLVTYVSNRIFVRSIVGASGMVCAMIACSCVLHEGQAISVFSFDPSYTAWINTGVVLIFLFAADLIGLRRHGIVPGKILEKGQNASDHLGHMVGYATGTIAGLAICQTSPYWRNVRRQSFWRTGDGAKRKGELIMVNDPRNGKREP